MEAFVKMFAVRMQIVFLFILFFFSRENFSKPFSVQYLSPSTLIQNKDLSAEHELLFLLRHESGNHFTNLSGWTERYGRENKGLSEDLDRYVSEFEQKVFPQYRLCEIYISLFRKILKNDLSSIYDAVDFYEVVKDNLNELNQQEMDYLNVALSLRDKLSDNPDKAQLKKVGSYLLKLAKKELEELRVVLNSQIEKLTLIDKNRVIKLDKVDKFIELSIRDYQKIFFWLNFYFQNKELQVTKISLYEWFQQQEGKENFDIESVKEVVLFTYSEALSFILKNLIENAKKHGNTIYFKLKAYSSGEEVVIAFSNRVEKENGFIQSYWLEEVIVKGQAIKAQRLFLQKFTTSEEDGQEHGIGLKLIWKMVQLMGGSIRAKSNAQETSFEIRLPLKSVDKSGVRFSELRLPHFSEAMLSPLEQAL